MEVITAGSGDAGLEVAGSFYQALEDGKDAQALALLREDATADDFRMSPRTARGPGEWKALLKSWRGALGSFKELPLMNQLVVGDYVISERVANGAQRGREVSVHSVDIAQMKDMFDYTGEIDQAAYARGAKVWFRELTGIKPIPMAQIIDSSFALAAKQANPAG